MKKRTNRIYTTEFKQEAVASVTEPGYSVPKAAASFNILISWANLQDIKINFIQPGNPQQNAYIERYNRTVRYEWLGQYLFSSLDELQDYATRWQWFYNHERPNMALNGYTPMQHQQRMT